MSEHCDNPPANKQITILDDGVPVSINPTEMDFEGITVSETAEGKVLISGGDVIGPDGAVDDNFSAFDGATGKLIKDSGKNSADFADEAPIDGIEYVRLDAGWVPQTVAGGVPEAPIDGTPYSRQDAGWTAALAGGDVTGPASSTDNDFAQFDGITGKLLKDGVKPSDFDPVGSANTVQGNLNVHTADLNIHFGDAPSDGTPYAREDAGWVAAAGGIEEAPIDGITYGRKDAAWAAVGNGTGDVVGPASAVDNNFAQFDGVTGKLIDDGGFSSTSFDIAGAASGVQSNLNTHTADTDIHFSDAPSDGTPYAREDAGWVAAVPVAEAVTSVASAPEDRIAEIVSLTQTEYDAIVTKQVDKLYIITT